MSVELNHTIVHSRDNRESAEFLADLPGLETGPEWGPFVPVVLANGVTLDFTTIPATSITPQHYAFLIPEAEFDAAFARIQEPGIAYSADPHRKLPGEINHNDGGRGVHFPRSGRSRPGSHHPPVRRLSAGVQRPTGSRSSGRSHMTAGGWARTVPVRSAPTLR